LNLYFVIVLQMSVAGVAIATVISESVSAVLVTMQLMRENDSSLHLDLRKIKMDPLTGILDYEDWYSCRSAVDDVVDLQCCGAERHQQLWVNCGCRQQCGGQH
jgi:hypothetical protein